MSPFPKTSKEGQITKGNSDSHPNFLNSLATFSTSPKQLKVEEKNIPVKKKTFFGHLIILVCRHSDEFSFGEQVCPKCTIRKFQDVIGSHNVEPGLVFVHGVQYSLQGQGGGETHINKDLGGPTGS